ncbi:unnamed protein product, partial [Mesorhabditis spiculigera]
MVLADTLLCVNSIIGYFCNGILVYCILATPNSRMGTYRYLILVLAYFNIVYSTAHLLVIPVTYIRDFYVIFYSSSYLGQCGLVGYLALLAYCSLFAQSNMLLAFHFIYRYICICRTELLQFLNEPVMLMPVIVAYMFYTWLWIISVHLFMGSTPDFLGRVAADFHEFSGFWPNETAVVGNQYL